MRLYENLGFRNHPFAKTNADEEPDLANYFVPPPYFDAVVGDSNSPSASIVLAPRGAGKSALRRMVEAKAEENQFLAVTYDRFEFSSGFKLEDVSLSYHMRNIITRTFISFLSYLTEYPDVARCLSKEEQKQVNMFINTYIGDMSGEKFQEVLKEIKSLPERLKDYWSHNIKLIEPVVNIILKHLSMDKVDLKTLKSEEKVFSETYKYQLGLLSNLVRKLGFKSIYILIDRVDESSLTGNDPEASYRLVQPIIKDLDLLGFEGFGFKFFLWDKVTPYLRKDARPDRVNQYEMNWTRATLKKLLTRRLQSYSNNKLSTLTQLAVTVEGVDFDDIFAVLANGSPRTLIRYCEKVLAIQAERDSDTNKIQFAAIDRATVVFAESLCKEVYENSVVKAFQKIGKEVFTINFIANEVFKISNQAARNKITQWSNQGAIKQIGTVALTGVRKPVNHYCVVDPSLVRLIHRVISIDQFFYDRWKHCDYCEAENLINISLYPEDNEAVCRDCGRSLA